MKLSVNLSICMLFSYVYSCAGEEERLYTSTTTTTTATGISTPNEGCNKSQPVQQRARYIIQSQLITSKNMNLPTIVFKNKPLPTQDKLENDFKKYDLGNIDAVLKISEACGSQTPTPLWVIMQLEACLGTYFDDNRTAIAGHKIDFIGATRNKILNILYHEHLSTRIALTDDFEKTFTDQDLLKPKEIIKN